MKNKAKIGLILGLVLALASFTSSAYSLGLIGTIKNSRALENLDKRVKEAQQSKSPASHAPVISNPTPLDNAMGIATSGTMLSWLVSDQDGDAVMCDVRFGTDTLVMIATNLAMPQYTLPELAGSTTYRWQIVATDSKGSVTVGPTWKFTTVVPPPKPTVFPLKGIAGVKDEGGELTIYFDGVFYNSETGLLSGTATEIDFGIIPTYRLSFNLKDLQNPPAGTITYCKIRDNGELIGWGRWVYFPPDSKYGWWSVSSDTTGQSPIEYNVIFDKTTGKFSGWSWGDGWGWINWGDYYGPPYGVYIENWQP